MYAQVFKIYTYTAFVHDKKNIEYGVFQAGSEQVVWT